MELSKGANTAVPTSSLRLTLTASGPVLDLSALLLVGGRVRSDDDFVFFNQPRHASGAVALSGDTVEVDLSRVEPAVATVVLAAAVDGGRLADVRDALLVVRDAAGAELARCAVTGAEETALVVAELYRRGDGWKLRHVSQGWVSGLAGLATDYGISVDEEPAPAPVIDLVKPPTGAISLRKDQRVSFAKTSEQFTVSLRWTVPRADLDLYALYVDDSGRQGAVYYKDLGSLQEPPYMALSGDAQTGGASTVETIRISRTSGLRHVLFCAYSAVSNGTGSFKGYGASIEVDDHAGSTVTSPLYDDNDYSYWVAIAHVDLSAPGEVSVQQVERYSGDGVENRPVLHPDGRIEMDAGVVEFKGIDLGDLDAPWELDGGTPGGGPGAAGKPKKKWFKG